VPALLAMTASYAEEVKSKKYCDISEIFTAKF